MYTLNIHERELWDERKEVFVKIKNRKLVLEHSLVSISKWESKWHKPFLKTNKYDDKMTRAEIIDYVRCMTITQNIPDEVYEYLTDGDILEINDYINDSMTATIVKRNKQVVNNNEFITNELIYYWMIELGIPVEFEKWHLNRLLTLIDVCNIKKNPGKKMSKSDVMRSNAAKNAARRAKMHSKG